MVKFYRMCGDELFRYCGMCGEKLKLHSSRGHRCPPENVPASAEQEQKVIDLVAAGWKKVSFWQWQAPNGELFIGPHGAWKVMRGVDPENDKPTANETSVDSEIRKRIENQTHRFQEQASDQG